MLVTDKKAMKRRVEILLIIIWFKGFEMPVFQGTGGGSIKG
jgi:hypothetical protein